MGILAGLILLAIIGGLVIGRRAPSPSPEPMPAPRPAALPGRHNEWDNQVRYACSRFGMTDPLALIFVKAVIQQESGWAVRARGDYDAARCPEPYRGDPFYAGYCAIGLMQVHRYWHPDLASAGDLREPNWNIVAGCKVLAAAYRRWWPDWRRVYAEYNGGPDDGANWPNASAEVQQHVASVGAIYRLYAAAAGIVVA